MGYPPSLIQVQPRDLTPYRRGDTGVDYVHTFDSGLAGPHFMVNALSKGNELCGSEAVATLLDDAVRPTRGRLTLSFANVEAYRTLDVHDPAPSKFLDVNFNRIWKDEIIDGPPPGSGVREIERARQMRPVVRAADVLLDLLSDCFYRAPDPWYDPPLLSYIEKPATRRLGDRIGFPLHHVGCPAGAGGEHSGLLFEYGRFSDEESAASGFLAECGPHFARLLRHQLPERHGPVPVGARDGRPRYRRPVRRLRECGRGFHLHGHDRPDRGERRLPVVRRVPRPRDVRQGRAHRDRRREADRGAVGRLRPHHRRGERAQGRRHRAPHPAGSLMAPTAIRLR